MAIAWPQPSTESDDGWVAVCAMLEAPSAVSSSSSSSSDSSGSKSIMASPPLVPDLLISAELQDIPEMLDVEAAHQTEPVEMRPHNDTSIGAFLYILWCHVDDFIEFDIGCLGAYDGGDADAGLC
jgi:hypothetical protein